MGEGQNPNPSQIMARILQGNIARSPTAFGIFEKKLEERKVDSAFISEPEKVSREGPNWIPDNRKKAVIWVPDQGNLPISKKGTGNGFAWIKSGNIIYASWFFKPPTPGTPDTCNTDLEELEEHTRRNHRRRGLQRKCPELGVSGNKHKRGKTYKTWHLDLDL